MNRNNSDNNTEAVKIANALKPFAKKWFDDWGQSCVRSKKMTVSTAPNGSVIGVTDAFSDTEVFIKYMPSCANARVGDTVWCKWMYDNMQTLYADEMGSIIQDRIGAYTLGAYGRIVNTGWYRILQFDADSAAIVQGDDGFIVDVTIVEWARQIHKISLAGVLGKLAWIDEFSYSQHNYFDKIRYMQNGTHGYVDVHFSGNNTSNRYQSAYFDIKTVHQRMQHQFKSVDFDAVSDAPSGETVVATYNFNSDTPFIVESGTNSGWKYRQWSDGRIETWNVVSVSVTLSTIATYYHRGSATITLPFTISEYESIQCTSYTSTYWMSVSARTSTSLTLSIYDVVNGSQTVWVSCHIIGKL